LAVKDTACNCPEQDAITQLRNYIITDFHERCQVDTFCKVGFHVGPGGNLTGLGDWMRKLDGAGIPFFLKSADHYGVLFEGANIAADSGIEHQLVYRQSTGGQNDGFDYDVPDYSLEAAEAAERHWQATRDKLPPEFDPARVWVEPVNEVDKNRCDWLGRFAVHYANLALADGYKVTMFGWASGEPEMEGWETEGMLTYLRVCAARPEQAAVALHEYDADLDGFEAVYPFHLGRFQYLFAVCDKHGIDRPTVHITEWGWAQDRVPSWEKARPNIEAASRVYAPFPQIKGAAIWSLGQSSQSQQLIAPLGEFIVAEWFPVPDLMPGTVARLDSKLPGLELGQPGGASMEESRARSDGRYLADITIPNGFKMAAGQAFSKSWLVQNSGDVGWMADFRLVHVGGKRMGETAEFPVPQLDPGEQAYLTISLTAPDSTGTQVGDWQLQDGEGGRFGDILVVRINTARRVRMLGQDAAEFVADITITAETTLSPGQSFIKIWRVKNTGLQPWAVGCQLAFVEGNTMGGPDSQPIPLANPGQDVELTISMTAPTAPGMYTGSWHLQDEQGEAFGEAFVITIVVTES
jgi:uncharacterized protein affecting Mg2+/Co2+ transport